MSQETRYARYCSWCEKMRIPPAPFESWKRTVAKVSELRLLRD